MLRAPIDKALPGMTLAIPVRHPTRPERVLLKSGYVLDDAAIEKLRTMGAPEVWVRLPGMDFIAKHINPEAMRLQAELSNSMGEAIEAVNQTGGSPIRYADFESTMRRLLHELCSSPHAGVMMGEICCEDRVILQHSMHVAMLSLMMGLRLDGYLVRERRRLSARQARDVVNLGLGALFHDIGLLRIDPDAFEEWKRTGVETPEWRRHAPLGFEQVREHLDPTASIVALHHHQTWDGAGFPRRRNRAGEIEILEGRRIHIFARIVAAADVFDRLRHPVAGEGAVPRVRALKRMLDDEVRRRVDPFVLRALLAVSPPYPPGMLVGLSDGRKGVVADWRPEDPCRPSVRIVEALDAAVRGEEADAPVVDLDERTDLCISEAEGEPVAHDNFNREQMGEIDLAAAERANFATIAEEDPRDLGADPSFSDAA